jgi:hypothetical protein
MQGMKLKFIGFALLISFKCFSQSDYIQLGNKQYQLLNRLDIKLRNDSILGFTTSKPYNRKTITERIELLDSLDRAGASPIELTAVDRYNIRRLLMNNVEWVRGNYSFDTSKPFLKRFYKNPAHFAAVKGNDFFFTVDPIINFSVGAANDESGSQYQNTRGIVIRGNVDRRIGFYTYLTENQERGPRYVRDYVNKFQALPGVGYLKNFQSNGYDYFDARGGITFNAGKHFDFQFAYDRLFLGNGYRSLFLSDFATNYMFLKINTRFWKLNNQSIFAELIAPFNRFAGDVVRPKKYLAAHHLSIQAAKWLNIGFFENIMFSRGNGFELSYLNPVIFYRSAEQQLGSADKATVGFDFKSNLKNNIQLYGQLVINEFHISEITRYGRGSWLNKHAVQLGAKYVDAFKIKNLDLQAEYNVVRPFTFSHGDSVTSYTHYNQPLAHPLGAGFREFIFNVKYQPLPKWYFNMKLMTWKQGLDSAGRNFGSNLFRGYNTSRPRDLGFYIGTGTPAKTFYGNITASYEVFENMFIDANALIRTFKMKGASDEKLSVFSIGFRMNIARREYEF